MMSTDERLERECLKQDLKDYWEFKKAGRKEECQEVQKHIEQDHARNI